MLFKRKFKKNHREFLIKQILDLSYQMNCGYSEKDFKFCTIDKLQKKYRIMSEDAVIWLEVFGKVFL